MAHFQTPYTWDYLLRTTLTAYGYLLKLDLQDVPSMTATYSETRLEWSLD